HRAGVDRARRRAGRGGLPCRLGVPLGLGSELVETILAAEIPASAGVRVLVFGGRSIQRHAANRVECKSWRGRCISIRHRPGVRRIVAYRPVVVRVHGSSPWARTAYSTVTDLARFLGLSTSLPRSSAAW